ncbi:MAG: hypothetical protein HKN00_07800 [Flavobacteriaceae bacterium]|nr:hypothetical protein [Bacteroidia bacterium]MBT8289156.1 hypothetical protein [Bacteroidia bacterium]NNF75070.1 hypothetical protein [Flavobacteriaceae bacterium]NNK72406.1 hypothetical protein [Flavobacteriaceae bacterium]
MKMSTIKKPLILAILFLLPVVFLLFLYPSTHNYNALDIVHGPVMDIEALIDEQDKASDFKDNISILLFLGQDPLKNAIGALNVKELVYDKFKGFKRFQIVAMIGENNEASLEELKKELYQYDDLEYWSFISANEAETRSIFNGLLSKGALKDDLSFEGIFIIDKDLMQRGRKDDRNKTEIKNNSEIYGLYSYNSIEVSELKNKISDDMRILFTEYRQKRKGNFNSSTRRVEDLTSDEKN